MIRLLSLLTAFGAGVLLAVVAGHDTAFEVSVTCELETDETEEEG